MTKRMLIDATQSEETRVVLTGGNRVEDFDFEVSKRRPLKGNIYLAQVTRVEPSLQAAFIEYGGNRHGFWHSMRYTPIITGFLWRIEKLYWRSRLET